MNVAMKMSAYVGVLAVVFVGAAGIGQLTGSSVNRDDATDAVPPHAAGDSHAVGGESADPHVPGGLQVSDAGYTLTPIDAPTAAGENGTLSFAVLGPDGEAVTEYDESHEKNLHVVVVRHDGAHYQHVHPVMDAYGSWSIDWEWPTGGSYKVFADFVPTGHGQEITLARSTEVAGTYTPMPALRDAVFYEVDGYTVTVTGQLVAGRSTPVVATVERDGQPVDHLEPHLGAYGHLVALREGDLAYIHVHPDGEPGDGATDPGPDVAFYVEAPTAGSYRLYLDFRVDGQVRTAEFALRARPAGDAEVADDAGGHGDTDGHGH
ncbi:hypothetical protein [Phytoactinopolyspora limicola]|uniref:hypothetical protein n=1 Tax=Phytoactinopolyspora limicola TaxID=2715536 RepID=UPI001A9C65D1|nr:hypothetical protein [Phytoactinopolyspora limicola]